MRQLLILLLCIYLHFQLFAQQYPVISVTALKDTTISKFSGDSLIKEKNLRDNFELHLRNSLAPDSVTVWADERTFKVHPDSPATIAGFNVYTMGRDNMVKGSNATITLWKDGKSYTILLKVSDAISSPSEGSKGKLPDCKPFEVIGKSRCEKNDFNNNFGIDTNNFVRGDVFYVYDFNKDVTQRRFYKLYWKKKFFGKATFEKERVNFSKESLKPNQQVYVKVHNVNRFIYNVSIADTAFNYDSEPSVLFQQMFLGDSNSLLGDLLESFQEINKKTTSEDSAKLAPIEIIKRKFECFYAMFSQLKIEMEKVKDPCVEFPCCSHIDLQNVIGLLHDLRGSLKRYELDFISDRKLATETEKKIKACQEKIAARDKAKLEWENLDLEATRSSNRASFKEALALKKKAYDDQPGCDELQKLQAQLAAIKDRLGEPDKIAEIASQLPTEQQLNLIASFVMNMVQQNQNLWRPAIQLTGDRLDLTIKIKSRDSTGIPNFPNVNEVLKYEIPVRYKNLVSFGSGLFVTPEKYLTNKIYSWQPVLINGNQADSTRFKLVESGYSSAPPGFAALAHVQMKFARNVGAGISGGVGVTIEPKPRMGILGGLSLLAGDARQFALTAGLCGMQVERLNNNFKNIADNQIIYTSQPAPEYYKEFKIGYFVSLTYTFFSITKRN